MNTAFTKSGADVLAHFQVKERDGLSDQQVQESRSKNGPNGRPDVSGKPFIVINKLQHWQKKTPRQYGR